MGFVRPEHKYHVLYHTTKALNKIQSTKKIKTKQSHQQRQQSVYSKIATITLNLTADPRDDTPGERLELLVCQGCLHRCRNIVRYLRRDISAHQLLAHLGHHGKQISLLEDLAARRADTHAQRPASTAPKHTTV